VYPKSSGTGLKLWSGKGIVMARIELCDIRKNYGKTEALRSINLVVDDKEFFVLFGPAGAGKTTILKLIAGIEIPSGGFVKINDKIVNLIEAPERNVAMVFENYALYPHMTIYDNIAFPLRSKLYRENESTIRQKVESITALLKIDTLLDRLPAQISNGQKQRVALGRSLVRNPNVFLMDEPLAHLDAKMRHFMRAELKEMQSSLNTTTVYVTHDYMEALSLGDRIAIINEGKIEQIGNGLEIYNTPANEFVAKLVGEPEINIFPVDLKKNTILDILGVEHDIPEKLSGKLNDSGKNKFDFGIRAQFIQHSFKKTDKHMVQGCVYSFEPIGNKAILIVDVNGTLLRITAPNDLTVEINREIYINFRIDKALFFDTDSHCLIAHSAIQGETEG
jgi:ABC-type sugar transport system ATPase subunit